METLNTADRARFLARFAPFDALDPAELETIAARAEERRYAAGELALIEDGRRSTSS